MFPPNLGMAHLREARPGADRMISLQSSNCGLTREGYNARVILLLDFQYVSHFFFYTFFPSNERLARVLHGGENGCGQFPKRRQHLQFLPTLSFADGKNFLRSIAYGAGREIDFSIHGHRHFHLHYLITDNQHSIGGVTRNADCSPRHNYKRKRLITQIVSVKILLDCMLFGPSSFPRFSRHPS